MPKKKRSSFLKVIGEQSMTMKSNFHIFEEKVHQFYGKSSTGCYTLKDIIDRINNLSTNSDYSSSGLNSEVEDSNFAENANNKVANYRFMPTTFFAQGHNQVKFIGNVDCIEVYQLEYPGIEKIQPYVPVNQETSPVKMTAAKKSGATVRRFNDSKDYPTD